MNQKGSALLIIMFAMSILLILSVHLGTNLFFLESISVSRIQSAQQQAIIEGIMQTTLSYTKKNYERIINQIVERGELMIPVDLIPAKISHTESYAAHTILQGKDKGLHVTSRLFKNQKPIKSVSCFITKDKKSYYTSDWTTHSS